MLLDPNHSASWILAQNPKKRETFVGFLDYRYALPKAKQV
jgi:hypothetical protein